MPILITIDVTFFPMTFTLKSTETKNRGTFPLTTCTQINSINTRLIDSNDLSIGKHLISCHYILIYILSIIDSFNGTGVYSINVIRLPVTTEHVMTKDITVDVKLLCLNCVWLKRHIYHCTDQEKMFDVSFVTDALPRAITA